MGPCLLEQYLMDCLCFVGCHDIAVLARRSIKWWQHPGMTIAVDWDVKHQIKQSI